MEMNEVKLLFHSLQTYPNSKPSINITFPPILVVDICLHETKTFIIQAFVSCIPMLNQTLSIWLVFRMELLQHNFLTNKSTLNFHFINASFSGLRCRLFQIPFTSDCSLIKSFDRKLFDLIKRIFLKQRQLLKPVLPLKFASKLSFRLWKKCVEVKQTKIFDKLFFGAGFELYEYQATVFLGTFVTTEIQLRR